MVRALIATLTEAGAPVLRRAAADDDVAQQVDAGFRSLLGGPEVAGSE